MKVVCHPNPLLSSWLFDDPFAENIQLLVLMHLDLEVLQKVANLVMKFLIDEWREVGVQERGHIIAVLNSFSRAAGSVQGLHASGEFLDCLEDLFKAIWIR